MSSALPVLSDRSVQAFCAQPFTRLKVSSEGVTSQCCWQQKGAIGNLLEQSFDQVWHGPTATAIRQDIEAGKLHPACDTEGCNFRYRERPAHKLAWTNYPTILDIDPPNTHCNTACIMCPRSDPKFVAEENRLTEVLERVKFLMPHLKHLQVQGLTEPHWKGILHVILDHLGFDAHRDNCRVLTFTNGSTLDGPTRDRFFERVPWSLTYFSLDAATPDTFRAIRKLPFDTVLRNLRACVRERRDSQRQVVMVNNNINLLNVAEAERMMELVADCGADAVTFNVTDRVSEEITGLTLHEHDNPVVARRFRAAHQAILAAAERLGIPVSFYKPLDLGKAAGAPLPLAWGSASY